MKRYLPSRRTRSNVLDTSALRDQFIRDLTREAEALMKQLMEQFTQTLQTQAAQAFQGIVAGDSTTPAPMGEAGTLGSVGQLLSTGVRYLVSRPQTSHHSAESQRSVDAQSAFRLSSAQHMAEAQQAIQRGEKNL